MSNSSSSVKGKTILAHLFVISLLSISMVCMLGVSAEEEDQTIPQWLHEELGTDPDDPTSLGVYVLYDPVYNTLKYDCWETFENGTESITIARERVVIRRGTTLQIGGYTEAEATIHSSGAGMDTLNVERTGEGWSIDIPGDSTVGKYVFSLSHGNWTDEMDIYVIFDPWTTGISQEDLRAYAYDEDGERDEYEYMLKLRPDGTTEVIEGVLNPFGGDQQLSMYEFALSAVSGSEEDQVAAARLSRVAAQRCVAVNPGGDTIQGMNDASDILFGEGVTNLYGMVFYQIGEIEYVGLTIEDGEVLGRNGESIEGILNLTQDERSKVINSWNYEAVWAKTALLRSVGIPSRVVSIHMPREASFKNHHMVEVWLHESLHRREEGGNPGGWYVYDADERYLWGECISSRADYGRMGIYNYEIEGFYASGRGSVQGERDFIEVTSHYTEVEDLVLEHGSVTNILGRGGGDYYKVDINSNSRLRLVPRGDTPANMFIEMDDYPYLGTDENLLDKDVVLARGTYYLAVYAPKNGDPIYEGDHGEYTLTLERTPHLLPDYPPEEPTEVLETGISRYYGHMIGILLVVLWVASYFVMKRTWVDDRGVKGDGDNRVWSMLTGIVEYLENVPLTPVTAFAFLVVIGVVRSVTESVFFEYPVFSMYLVVQHTAFNFPVLVMGVLILKLASGAQLKKVYTIIILGFVFVAIPPFIDYYILGHAGVEDSSLYGYFAADLTFFDKVPDLNIVNMWRAEEISSGLKIMGTSILICAGLYVAVKRKFFTIFTEIRNRMWKPVVNKLVTLFFAMYGIWMVIWFISAVVPTVFSFTEKGITIFDHINLSIYSRYYIFMERYGYSLSEITMVEGMGSALAKQQRSLYITMLFFILTTAVMLITMRMTHRDLFGKIIRSIRKPVVLITTGSALLGSAAVHMLDPDYSMGWALNPGYILHVPYVFYIGAMGFFLGTFASFVSSYGREGAELPKWASKNMALVSLMAGGSFAFLMGPFRALPIFAVCAGLIYLCFKEGNEIFTLFHSLLFSVVCSLIFLLGVYTPDVWKMRILADATSLKFVTLDLARTPSLDGSVVLLMMALFTAVFVVTFFPRICGKMERVCTLPGSLVLLPVFLMPAAVGVGLIALGIVAALCIFALILMDKDLAHLPIPFFGMALFVYALDLWGFFSWLF